MSGLEMAALLKLIEDGIRVLRTLESVQVSDEQCEERANGIGAQILGNYMVVPLPDAHPAGFDWDTSFIAGRPLGHTWSCMCRPCAEYKARVTVEEQAAEAKQKEGAQ